MKVVWVSIRTPLLSIFIPLVVASVVVAVFVLRSGHLGMPHIPPVTSSDVAQANKMAEATEVIIVGGGVAGMSAAYTLEYLGIPYTLLEASTQVGGRVRQLNRTNIGDEEGLSSDVPLDLGAEWIHVMPDILSHMILFDQDKKRAEDISIINYRPQSYRAFVRGKLRTRSWLRFFYQEYKFRDTTWWSYFASLFQTRIESNIVTNAVVETIQYNQTSVIVTTRDGTIYSGSHVIVATPATILQDRDIQFIPDLPQDKWDAIDSVDMAPGFKLWFKFSERFYADMEYPGPILFPHNEDEEVFFNAVFRKPTNENILCLFHVGEHAQDLVALTDTELIAHGLALLEGFHGRNDLSSLVEQVYLQNWSNEPFIRGAYSVNHGSYNEEVIQEPVIGTIFFAGEYLAGSESATVHGAAISGRQAALQVIREYGKIKNAH